MELALVIGVIVIALVFDYTNGFHDAANAIATSVSTRALTPRVALLLAAVMNFIGAHLGTEVAQTVGKGIIDAPDGTHGLLIVGGALIGAIVWNLITWYFGLPSSSSHALIGGLVGSALAASANVHWSGVVEKVVIPMVLSPVIGFVLGGIIMIILLWLFRKSNPHRTSRGFRYIQPVSAAAIALGHGLQDAQKTMGVIFLALVVGGYASPRAAFPSGSSRPRPRRSPSAPTPAAGASCGRWAGASSTWTRRAVSRPRRRRRRSSTPPPSGSAPRSRPRTP